MATRNLFTANDIPCIVADNATPGNATVGNAVAFSVDVTVAPGTTGATIATVEADFGEDAASGFNALTLGTAPNYTGGITYASAGTKEVTIRTTLSTGEVQLDYHKIKVE